MLVRIWGVYATSHDDSKTLKSKNLEAPGLPGAPGCSGGTPDEYPRLEWHGSFRWSQSLVTTEGS